MRVAALFSGGKDSTWALRWAMEEGMDVAHLVSVFSTTDDSWMYQVPGVELARLAAKALGIPQVEVHVDGTAEQELDPLRDALARLNVEGVVSGAIRSRYQRDRLDRLCAGLGLRSIAPLWHTEPGSRLRAMTAPGWDVRMVGVSAEGLGPELLGVRWDEQFVQDLAARSARFRLDVDGEGGEYETVVLRAPGWTARIEPVRSRVAWHRDRGTWVVEEARLVRTDPI